jgi:SpoVK/Ycf46/Vps4 family AAA+-type ATPase
MSEVQPQSLLNRIENVSKAACKCNLDFNALIDVEEDITRISEFLSTSRNQTILMACFVDLSLQRTVTLDHIARHLKSSTIKILNSFNEIIILEMKSYIMKCNKANGRKFSHLDFGYVVPFNVIEALRTSDKVLLKQEVNFNLPNFLEKVKILICSREENAMTTAVLLDQIEFMVSNNLNHRFLQFINRSVEQSINKCLVFVLAYFRFKREYDYNIETIIQVLFDDLAEQMEYEQSLASGNNELFRNGIIRYKDSQFMNDRTITLTEKTLKILYKDYPELNINNESEESIIKVSTIKSKSLYFEKGLQSKVDTITNILSKRNFSSYQKKLSDKKLPNGITAIFYGKPGTGKTESVFQIAKKTHRDIMMVDLSQMRSKWFGESEKQVKKVFDDYRRLAEYAMMKPILFINEADGLISKRMEFKNGSSTVDQTLNLIQNIILQELEVFDGILFATTNLTTNLDSAFERRFLFKVEFDNPVAEASQKIWQSRLPELSHSQVAILSSRYNLSGGEIENITRKYIIDNIIGNVSLEFERLLEFCDSEKPFQKQRKIGF